ncbi:MAG TPA: hypothetical protein VIG06_09665 [Kofleriaceae bacterium]|jgi:hypothetical protein
MNRSRDEGRRDPRPTRDRDDRGDGTDRQAEERRRSPWPIEPVLHDA